MKTSIVSAAFSGRSMTELKYGTADCWLIYLSKGKADFLTGEKICHAVAGQVVIVGMTEQTVQIRASADYESCVLQIKSDASSERIQRYLLLMDLASEPIHIIATGRQEESIRKIFRDIVAEVSQHMDGSGEILDLLLQELLVRIYRVRPKSHATDHAGRFKIVSAVRSRLENEYSQPFGLNSIASEYNISVSYLSHIFKEIVGIPIMRYLLNCRINAAKAYLEQTALSMNEIAEACGFNDYSNFSRTFRKETGYSPRQYRYRYHATRHTDGEKTD